MLHQGKLVGAGAHVVKDARNEQRLNLAVEHPGRAFNRLLSLATGELRCQELAVVERLGEPVEAAQSPR